MNLNIAKYDADDTLFKWKTTEKSFKSKKRLNGGFWKYINRSGIDLTKYQIFNDYNKENYQDNCFIYACKQSGLFDEHDIHSLIYFIKVNRVPVTTVREISETFKIPIVIRKFYNDGDVKKDYDIKVVLDTTKNFDKNAKVLSLLLYHQ